MPTSTASRRASVGASKARTPEWRNHVILRGRLTTAAEPVALPSGDELWRFRVTVPRAEVRADGRSVVDAIDCSTTSASLAGRLVPVEVGSVVEVGGAVQRRFWRSPTGPASRYEVRIVTLKVVRRVTAAAS